MILTRNDDVELETIRSVDGARCHGGELHVKPLMWGDEMTLLEFHFAAGVGTSTHTHEHESLLYVVKGTIRSRVGGEEFILGPGDVCRHPRDLPHNVEAIEESLVIEIKSPAPDPGALLGLGL